MVQNDHYTYLITFFGFLPGAIAAARAHFGEGTGPIHLDNLECTGMEGRLDQCVHQGVGINNCGHREDAGVLCQRKMVVNIQVP